DGYFLQNLCGHFIAAGRAEELAELYLDLRWLEAKNEAGLTFDLPEDFATVIRSIPIGHNNRHILRLVEEAIRRDIHFIVRHANDYPQALFQCLWNGCWWYDAPGSAGFYKPPESGWRKNGAPWARRGARLFKLLEQWRRRKEARASF